MPQDAPGCGFSRPARLPGFVPAARPDDDEPEPGPALSAKTGLPSGRADRYPVSAMRPDKSLPGDRTRGCGPQVWIDPSVTTECFLEPPGAVLRGDLGVDDERTRPRPVEPGPHRAEVLVAPNRHAVAAESAPDPGEVSGREPHGVERVPFGCEMVHLRAVRRVVVDHDDHGQAEPDHGLELADPHQRAAVAEGGDGKAVRPG